MFEWDGFKGQKNLLKHGVSFSEATHAFSDPLGLDGLDATHSSKELRYLRIARGSSKQILTIVYTLRISSNGKNTIRIISARAASKKETKAYKEGIEEKN